MEGKDGSLIRRHRTDVHLPLTHLVARKKTIELIGCSGQPGAEAPIVQEAVLALDLPLVDFGSLAALAALRSFLSP